MSHEMAPPNSGRFVTETMEGADRFMPSLRVLDGDRSPFVTVKCQEFNETKNFATRESPMNANMEYVSNEICTIFIKVC